MITLNILHHPLRTLGTVNHYLLHEERDGSIVHRPDVGYAILEVFAIPRGAGHRREERGETLRDCGVRGGGCEGLRDGGVEGRNVVGRVAEKDV